MPDLAWRGCRSRADPVLAVMPSVWNAARPSSHGATGPAAFANNSDPGKGSGVAAAAAAPGNAGLIEQEVDEPEQRGSQLQPPVVHHSLVVQPCAGD